MLLICVLSLLCVDWCLADGKPWEPEEWPTEYWKNKHLELMKMTREHKDTIKVVFIGASIAENWLNEGHELWQSYYEKHGSANYGIGGDGSQNVLWRIQNKELDGLNPKLIVFSMGCGANSLNRGPAPTAAEVLRGMEEDVKELRQKFPLAKVLIFGHTPYPNPDIDAPSKQNNIAIQKIVDNQNIFFFNLSPQLVDNKGKQILDLFIKDHEHLSSKGYELWHKTWLSLFEKLIK